MANKFEFVAVDFDGTLCESKSSWDVGTSELN